MKKIILLVAAAFIAVSSYAQSTFVAGDKVVSAAVGFGSFGIPVQVSYEQGVYDVNEKMSIGAVGLMGYGAEKEKFGAFTNKFSNFVIAVGGNYHYFLVKNMDLYAGFSLGYNIASGKAVDNTSDKTLYKIEAGGFFYAFQAGARYYFNENWAVGAEVGYGLGYFRIGASYKF